MRRRIEEFMIIILDSRKLIHDLVTVDGVVMLQRRAMGEQLRGFANMANRAQGSESYRCTGSRPGEQYCLKLLFARDCKQSDSKCAFRMKELTTMNLASALSFPLS